MTPRFQTVDAYIASFPQATQVRLAELRAAIRATAPVADELISYNMPAYKYKGLLVYFAGYNAHVGFYPTSSPIPAFATELEGYVTSKGTVRFSLEKPIPKALVRKIVRFKMTENEEKERLRKKRPKGDF
jgi:uncharacterized protein YdhG (YjbR/CyaY superfamily)